LGERRNAAMYGIYLGRRSNLAAGLLIPLITISILVASVPLTTQTKPITVSFAKISPTLLNKITNQGSNPIDVLIEVYPNAQGAVTTDIHNLGGDVRYQYKYIDALAATLPANKITSLAENPNVKRIFLDEIVTPAGFSGQKFSPKAPKEIDSLLSKPHALTSENIRTITLTPGQFPSLSPSTYWNYKAMNVEEVWDLGYTGWKSTVAVIDTGIYSQHFMLMGSVIGGIDVSPDVGTPWEGYDRLTNHWHGSHVAGIIAGHGALLLPPDHLLVQSIEYYTGETLETLDGDKVVPLLGIAPWASLYIIKVFPHTGAGVPSSIVIAGIDHAIELKQTGQVDIDIISMSLGGPTLYDGRGIMDLAVDRATEAGITVVSAAGNEGPASMTHASPGSAHTGLGVAAAAHPINTKVFWDYYYGELGIGDYLFTSPVPQIHAFSSRGPTSDGRAKPDVAATGVFVLSAYPTGPPTVPDEPNPDGLAFASGTSMATPAVSGAIALLNDYAEVNELPTTPEDYKQAIKAGAVPLPGYDERDFGSGYLNVGNAFTALIEDPEYGSTPEEIPPAPEYAVDITNIPIHGSGVYTEDIIDLAPGFKKEYIFNITAETDSIRLDITNVYLGDEDPLGYNSFEIYIQSAKRTFYGYYIDSANVWGNATFYITDDETTWSGNVTGVFTDPYTRVIEPGYMRIVIENDWTSYDEISGTIRITVTETTPPTPDWTISGEIIHDETTPWMEVPVPIGTEKAILELWWINDWTRYPASDLDMYINFSGPYGPYNYDGVTLNAPERAVLERPSTIHVMIHAYEINTGEPEPWELKVWFISEQPQP
jgi:subtilisin family serine protease